MRLVSPGSPCTRSMESEEAMTKRSHGEDLKQMMIAATDEAKQRGDRRIGTEHMLIGLLNDPISDAARALDVSLDSARAASVALDREALSAIGVEVDLDAPLRPSKRRFRPALTSGASSVMRRSVQEMVHERKTRRPQSRHLLLALLSCERPDPAAELLAALDVDPADVRARLAEFS